MANNSIFKILPRRFQMNLLSRISTFALPKRSEKNPIVAPISEANHFRRGIQNMRVNCIEWEIPIPPLKSDPSKPDYSTVQKAWWAVIKIVYDRMNKDKRDIPMRGMPLDMRITGGSSVHIAPQYGNDRHGTCSIEVLTPEAVDKAEWIDFMQEVSDAWLSLKDDDGKPIHPFENEKGELLYVRPHWAKEWDSLKVNNEPIEKYLKEKAFKDQIPMFLEGLEAAANAGGYTLEDANKVFSNKFSRTLFTSSDNIDTKYHEGDLHSEEIEEEMKGPVSSSSHPSSTTRSSTEYEDDLDELSKESISV